MTMQSQAAGKASVQEAQSPGSPATQRRSRRGWLIGGAIFLVFAGVLVSGILERIHTNASLRTETADLAVPTVSVVAPKRAAPSQEIVLPGNVQPYITSPVFARTNGYLEHWYYDIGAHVKKGQLLAVIASPEVDQQLQQARSNLLTAQANLELASITKDRYQGLKKTNAVSQQDVDNAVGTYNANKAIVEADQAAVQQYSALVSFEKVYAPFDGVITARNTDIGDLINSGSTANVKTDLFHIAQPGVLRVYVNVPEDFSQQTTPGLTAELTLAEFPGRKFTGKLVRTAESINYATRTLLVEVDVNNPSGQLLSGAYAEVHFKVPGQVSTYILPVDTLLFRKEGLNVAIVENGKAKLIPVVPGHDFGDSIEIVSGLQGNESVIMSPPDSIVTGEKVQIAQPAATPVPASGGAKQ
ncbi:MAG TPA: efflux RND transporter periplasmic adaptor subunit [Candidatus Acidoferrales bacterium]|nr:efflux RND transporter periplasmic adaptor subunit [Candidatus Acidoferrales bacterium]